MTSLNRCRGRSRGDLEAAFVLPVLLIAASCAGDGILDAGGGTPTPGPAVTFSSLQAEIFTPRCALPGCHASPFAAQGLVLSEGESYAKLVGVPSVELPIHLRVAPGDPDDSYLLMKLAGDPRIDGERMPLVGAYLDAEELDRVRRWIAAGAPDD